MNRQQQKKDVKLVVAYPSGNTTALMFGQVRLNPISLNTKIMKFWKNTQPTMSEIEQCCLILPPNNLNSIGRVQMLGGEFCGNATRCAVKVLVGKANQSGTIEVSGSEEALKFQVRGGVIRLTMPRLKAPPIRTKDGYLVCFDGIKHLVILDPLTAVGAKTLIEELIRADKYGFGSSRAVGVCFYSSLTGMAKFAVYVKAVDTIFEETACGSGSASIAIARAVVSKKNQKLELRQPSGEIITATADIDKRGKILRSTISGEIKVLYEGEVKL